MEASRDVQRRRATFPPTDLAIQEVKDLRDPAGDKRLRAGGMIAFLFDDR